MRIWYQKNGFKPPDSFSADRSKSVVLLLFVLRVALWLHAVGLFVFVFCPVHCLLLLCLRDHV